MLEHISIVRSATVGERPDADVGPQVRTDRRGCRTPEETATRIAPPEYEVWVTAAAPSRGALENVFRPERVRGSGKPRVSGT